MSVPATSSSSIVSPPPPSAHSASDDSHVTDAAHHVENVYFSSPPTSPASIKHTSQTLDHTSSTSTTTTTSSSPPSSAKCSPPFYIHLRYWILAFVVLLLIITCLVMWSIGYVSVKNAVDELSTEIQFSLAHLVHERVVSNLQRAPLACSRAVQIIELAYPALALAEPSQPKHVENFKQLFQDIFSLLLYSPGVGSIGISSNRFIMLMDQASDPNQPPNTVRIGWSDWSTNYTLTFTPVLSPFSILSAQPLSILTTSYSLQPLIDVDHLWSIASNRSSPGNVRNRPFNPPLRPFYKHALWLKGKTGYTAPYAAISNATLISAVVAHPSPSSTSDNFTESFVCAASLSTITLGDFLSDLPLRTGFALLLSHDTTTGLDSVMAISSRSPKFPPLQTVDVNSPFPILRAAAQLLVAARFNFSQLTPTANEFPYVIPGSRIPFVLYLQSISVQGTDYWAQVQAVEQAGFYGFVIIFLVQSDYQDNIINNNIRSGVASAAVLVGSILITILVAHFMSKPLLELAVYMQKFNLLPSENYVQSLQKLSDDWTNRKHQRNRSSDDKRHSDSSKQKQQLVEMQSIATTQPIDAPTKSESSSTTEHTPSSSSSTTSTSLVPASSSITPSSSSSSCCGIQEVHTIDVSFASMLQNLIVSRQMADQADHAKRQFLRFVFHEARVPLNAVILATDELRSIFSSIPGQIQSLLPNDISDLILLISEQNANIRRILNDVLSLQRIEDGEVVLEIEIFDLGLMCMKTIFCVMTELKQKQLSVSLQIGEGMEYQLAEIESFYRNNQKNPINHVVGPLVYADQHRLYQVISNYLSNAIKFSRQPNGHIKLVVQYQQVENKEFDEYKRQHARLQSTSFAHFIQNSPIQSLLHLNISVHDTGVGLTPEQVSGLFQAYRQFNASRMQSGGGSGLGLDICRRIMTLHSGSVSCKSEVGKGSIFDLNVIVKQASEEDYRSQYYSYEQEAAAPLPSLPSADSMSTAKNDTSETAVVRMHFDPQNTSTPRQTSEEQDMHQLSPPRLHFDDTSSTALVPFPVSNESKSTNDAPPFTPTPSWSSHDSQHTSIMLPPQPTFNNSDASSRSASSNSHTPPNASSNAPITRVQSAHSGRSTDCSTPSTPSILRSRTITANSTINLTAPAPAPITKFNKRALVAEDSIANNKLLCLLLKRMGFTVITVFDGQAAVDVFTSTPITPTWECPVDVILMDGNMPVMNGIEATRLIRAMGITIPIIAVTGNALAEDRAQFMAAGATIILTKPITKVLLEETIARELHNRDVNTQAQSASPPASSVSSVSTIDVAPLTSSSPLTSLGQEAQPPSINSSATSTHATISTHAINVQQTELKTQQHD